MKDGKVWSDKVGKIYRYRKKGIRYRAMVGPLDFSSSLSGNWTCFAAYGYIEEKGQKRIGILSKSIKCKEAVPLKDCNLDCLNPRFFN